MNIETVDMLNQSDWVFWDGRWQMVEKDVRVERGVAYLKLHNVDVIETNPNQHVFTNSSSVMNPVDSAMNVR